MIISVSIINITIIFCILIYNTHNSKNRSVNKMYVVISSIKIEYLARGFCEIKEHFDPTYKVFDLLSRIQTRPILGAVKDCNARISITF